MDTNGVRLVCRNGKRGSKWEDGSCMFKDSKN